MDLVLTDDGDAGHVEELPSLNASWPSCVVESRRALFSCDDTTLSLLLHPTALFAVEDEDEDEELEVESTGCRGAEASGDVGLWWAAGPVGGGGT